jgi:hypothetical protein
LFPHVYVLVWLELNFELGVDFGVRIWRALLVSAAVVYSLSHTDLHWRFILSFTSLLELKSNLTQNSKAIFNVHLPHYPHPASFSYPPSCPRLQRECLCRYLRRYDQLHQNCDRIRDKRTYRPTRRRSRCRNGCKLWYLCLYGGCRSRT